MTTMMAHKVALRPTKAQQEYFAQCSGTARLAYNWGLEQWSTQYAAWKENNELPKPSLYPLMRQFNAIKRDNWPWIDSISSNPPKYALMQLGEAFKNFFAGRAKYPTKRKYSSKARFELDATGLSVQGKRIRVPLLGWVKMTEEVRWSGKIKKVHISRVGGRWFASFAVETTDLDCLAGTATDKATGIDLGLKTAAVLADGTEYSAPKPYKAMEARLRRLSRSMSRKVGPDWRKQQKASENWKKAKRKIEKLHAKIANQRRDWMQKTTTEIARTYGLIGMEKLNVDGMKRNRRMAKAISDVAMFEFRREVEYKAALRGGKVVLAGTFYPSTKTCSNCGFVLGSIKLNTRQWACPACGAEHDRDVNAAINLKKLAEGYPVIACGEESSGKGQGRKTKARVKLASVKQEGKQTPIDNRKPSRRKLERESGFGSISC